MPFAARNMMAVATAAMMGTSFWKELRPEAV